jgi:hypothetical protein
VVRAGGDGSNQHKRNSRSSERIALPPTDPGDKKAHRWRKNLCTKASDEESGKLVTCEDPDKEAKAIQEAQHRNRRICEFENDGTIRGTEGTGEFERYTPAYCIEAARLVLGEIDLDPASSDKAQQTVKATQYFTAKSDPDGLKRDWHGKIWLNPPYHRELAPLFIDKLLAEFDAGRITAAIVLTNNCTDTDWFLKAQAACNAMCFTHGRIKFTQGDGKTEVLPTQGQTFFYFGPDVDGFASVFCQIGFGVVPRWGFPPREQS